jgi:hypothetical protein
MKDDQLDTAIDRAVRELMDVDPRPGMSHRVRARLETSPRPILTVRRLVTASALVLALLILAFATGRRERPADSIAVSKPPPTPTESLTNPQDMPLRQKPTDAVRSRVTSAEREDLRVQAVSLETLDVSTVPIQIEPMTPIAQIGIPRLEHKPLDSDVVTIKPLLIEEIEIAPLTSPR